MENPMAPLISRREDIAAHDRQATRVVGRYTQFDARMNPRPPPRYAGHVVLVLDDGTKVLLYPVWHPQARRGDAEISRFEGQRVEVSGTLYAQAPESREDCANLRWPCLQDITAIQAAPASPH
jgi:D-alanyl-D-alanine carboxypeptidase